MMAYYQLAEIYRSLNKYQAAIAAYQEIIAYPERNWYIALPMPRSFTLGLSTMRTCATIKPLF